MEGLISVILKTHIVQIVFLPKPRFLTIVQITPNDPENAHALGQIMEIECKAVHTFTSNSVE